MKLTIFTIKGKVTHFTKVDLTRCRMQRCLGMSRSMIFVMINPIVKCYLKRPRVHELQLELRLYFFDSDMFSSYAQFYFYPDRNITLIVSTSFIDIAIN